MVSQNISGARRHDIGDLIPHIVLASQNAPKISIHADGVDEEEAVKAIAGLLQ